MSQQVKVKCNKCGAILNFSAEEKVKREVNCIDCKQEITVSYTYIKVGGKRTEKVRVTGAEFIPESQRQKYNY